MNAIASFSRLTYSLFQSASEFGNSAFTRWFDNRFDTTLPTEVGQLHKLREFWMFNMGVKGTIPTEIGMMTDLGKNADINHQCFNVKVNT